MCFHAYHYITMQYRLLETAATERSLTVKHLAEDGSWEIVIKKGQISKVCIF